MLSKKRCTGTVVFLSLVVSFLFLLLYYRYIIGGFAYIFSDIGGDTLNSYYPQFILDKNILFNGELNSYSLQFGIGRSTAGIIFNYLNPFDIILLLFNETTMYVGILISTYFKLIAISICSYFYFVNIFKHNISCIIAAIIWTYCSYIILWGQHYQFCTLLALFSFFMLELQLFIESNKKNEKYFIISMVLLLTKAYSFFYMVGIFSIVYIIFYMWYRNQKLKIIFKKLFKLALLAFISIGICGISFSLSLYDFTNSVRGNIIQFNIDLFKPYNPQYFLTWLSRFFSNDYLHVGNSYTGVENYYESAMLSTSVLSLFSIFYFLFVKRNKKNLILIISCLLSLSFPIASLLLQGNGYSQRWSFLLCLVQVLAIGYFIDDLYNEELENNKKVILIILAFGFFILVNSALSYATTISAFSINYKSYAIYGALLIFYSVILINYNKNGKLINTKFIFMLVCFEMIISNWQTVNNRESISKESIKYDLYNDTTSEIVKDLKASESGLYRINKSYGIFLNDAYVQGYYGLSIYNSVNLKSAINYMNSLGMPFINGHPNYVNIPYERYYANTLLGQKFLLTKGNFNPGENYSILKNISNISVYENNNALPFGYLYFSELKEETFYELSKNERELALTESFYFTKYNDYDTQIKTEEDTNSIEIINNLSGNLNCEVKKEEKLIVDGVEDDMQLFFELNNTNHNYNNILINIEAEYPTQLQIFIDNSDLGYSEKNSEKIPINAGMGTYSISLDKYNNFNNIRIDPSDIKQNIKINSIRVRNLDENRINFNLSKLQSNGIDNAKLDGNLFNGNINNKSDGKAMLCIPIFYEKSWTAKIDGVESTLYDINGGLVGVEVTPGNHTVELCYKNQFLKIGQFISIFFLLFYIIKYFVIDFYKNYTYKKSKK